MAHEWIENNGDFEAVLVCTNELGAWDKDAVVRAFQIYQWDDATTPGNDFSFVHLTTGVVVRHDGNLLAIDCGHGHLDEALGDLFSVLHSIGWRTVELYHPAATIEALLSDIGRAIPARMDFEVMPAARVHEVQEFPESAAMASRARRIFAEQGIDETNAIVLEELQSMAPADEVAALASTPNPIITLDDQDEQPDDVVVLAPRFTSSAEDLASPSADTRTHYSDLDEQPQMFVLPVDPPEPEVRAIAPASYALPETISSGDVDEPTSMPEPDQKHIESATLRPSPETLATPSRPEVLDGVPPAAPAKSRIIKAGNALLCFDTPAARLDMDELRSRTRAHGVGDNEIIRIQPGGINSQIRWDVFAEFSAERVWSVAHLAEILLPGADIGLAAMLLHAEKKVRKDAQLRDLLEETTVAESDLALFIEDQMPASRLLLSRAKVNGELSKLLDAIVRIMGLLALVQDGQAFCDVRSASGPDGEPFQRFAVMSQMGKQPSVTVFETNSTDGPFVHWMVEVLHRLAYEHSSSTGEVYERGHAGSIENLDGVPATEEAALIAAEHAAQARAEFERAETAHRAALVEQLEQVRTSVEEIVAQLTGADLEKQT